MQQATKKPVTFVDGPEEASRTVGAKSCRSHDIEALLQRHTDGLMTTLDSLLRDRLQDHASELRLVLREGGLAQRAEAQLWRGTAVERFSHEKPAVSARAEPGAQPTSPKHVTVLQPGGDHDDVVEGELDRVDCGLVQTLANGAEPVGMADGPETNSPRSSKSHSETELKDFPPREDSGRRASTVAKVSNMLTNQAPDFMAGALHLREKLTQLSSMDRGNVDKQNDFARREFMKTHPIRGSMRYLASLSCFDTFFAVVVLVSVALIGIEIELTAVKSQYDQRIFLLMQSVCLFFFFIELVVRLGAFGRNFFISKDWKWNIFDLVCVLAMVADLAAEAAQELGGFSMKSSNNGHAFRVIRLMRIVRALRIMRATRASREFRKMSYALQYSAHTLFWALLLLCFVMYFFATAFTQAASERADELKELSQSDAEHASLKRLEEMYGTIPRSFSSLFMAITSGRDWWELLEPLQEQLHWAFVVLFLIFVAMMVFGIMNVLTSVFVESALQSVQHYKDLLIQESMKTKKMTMDHILEVFHEIDADGSGDITLDEMEAFLDDPTMLSYLESMGIQPDDARTLFRLLDKDDSGCVEIEEFCKGCLRLKGDAKSFDIHCIIYENQRLLHKWKEFMTYLDGDFKQSIAKAASEAVAQDSEHLFPRDSVTGTYHT